MPRKEQKFAYYTVAVPLASRLYQAIEDEAKTSGIEQWSIVIRSMLEECLKCRDIIERLDKIEILLENIAVVSTKPVAQSTQVHEETSNADEALDAWSDQP